MKKQSILISLFLISGLMSARGFCSDSAYQSVREGFKNALYNRQVGIMSWEEYNVFIEPYIQEAENALEVSNYLKGHPHGPAVSSYLHSLADYNVAVFHNTAISQSYILRAFTRSKALAHERLERKRQVLLRAIEDLKMEAGLELLSPHDEVSKTVELFHRANLAYYKAIGIGFKLKYPLLLLCSL